MEQYTKNLSSYISIVPPAVERKGFCSAQQAGFPIILWKYTGLKIAKKSMDLAMCLMETQPAFEAGSPLSPADS